MLFLAQEIRVIENFGGTAWTNETHMHPLALSLTIASGISILWLPRRYSVLAFIAMACLVAPAQRLVVGGLDFNIARILVVVGFCRVMLRSEFSGVRWMPIDWCVLAFAIIKTVMYTIQQASVHALVYQLGKSFDTVGMYFLFRTLIRRWDDVIQASIGFVVFSFPVLIAFVIENLTGRNAFAFLGGVPEITRVREGRMRCQGPFSHPIIAGCFWASILPGICALWWQGRKRRLVAVAGCVAVLGIVALTASSTPVMGVLFGVVGWLMFKMRYWMKHVCLGVVATLVALHLVMNKPVWHLVARMNISSGSTGVHRYLLIDSAIKRFDEWWLVGTSSTAHWFWGAQDVTNQYILEGVTGGFVTLIAFIVIIWKTFVLEGATWRLCKGSESTLLLSWSLGVCLFVHCINFIGVSYFGQITFVLYLHLASIVSMYEVESGRRRLAMNCQSVKV